MSEENIQYNVVSVETTTTQTEIKTSTKQEKSIDNSIPPYLYVLSDNVGYVGTYYSISDIEEITSSYNLVTFMIQCFKTSKKSDLFTVWVVLYKDIDAVAFVSNNREDAIKVQSTLMQVGITYIDSIDYWKQTVGLSKLAKDRLDAIHSVKSLKILDDSYNIFIKKIDLSTEKKIAIDNNDNNNKKINIMDAIIPSIIKNKNNDDEDANENSEDANENSEDDKDSNKDANENSEDDKDSKDEDIFCKNCENLLNMYEPNIDKKSLILFIANHCYNCFINIRHKYRKKKIELVQKNINTPIDSPFIYTNIDSSTPKIDNKLKEAMDELDNIFKLSEENIKNVDIQCTFNQNTEEDVEDVKMP